MAQNYTELLGPSIFNEGVPFYLGFYTGYNPWIIANGNLIYTGIYENPLFGWGQFVNNGGQIQLLDSALEIGGGGIYAGTQTIIPVAEPSVVGLFALASLLLGFRRRKK